MLVSRDTIALPSGLHAAIRNASAKLNCSPIFLRDRLWQSEWPSLNAAADSTFGFAVMAMALNPPADVSLGACRQVAVEFNGLPVDLLVGPDGTRLSDVSGMAAISAAAGSPFVDRFNYFYVDLPDFADACIQTLRFFQAVPEGEKRRRKEERRRQREAFSTLIRPAPSLALSWKDAAEIAPGDWSDSGECWHEPLSPEAWKRAAIDLVDDIKARRRATAAPVGAELLHSMGTEVKGYELAHLRRRRCPNGHKERGPSYLFCVLPLDAENPADRHKIETARRVSWKRTLFIYRPASFPERTLKALMESTTAVFATMPIELREVVWPNWQAMRGGQLGFPFHVAFQLAMRRPEDSPLAHGLTGLGWAGGMNPPREIENQVDFAARYGEFSPAGHYARTFRTDALDILHTCQLALEHLLGVTEATAPPTEPPAARPRSARPKDGPKVAKEEAKALGRL
jgi:hypothetical protein